MSRLSPHHEKLDEFGEGKCSVPMWSGGRPSGFCDAPAYGERMPTKYYWSYAAQRQLPSDGRYEGYVPALACPAHGGPRVRTFMDGNAWAAVKPDFINLQESAAGFGDTKEEAIAALGVKP